MMMATFVSLHAVSGCSFLCLRPANEGPRYDATSHLIGWVHAQNDPSVYLFQGLNKNYHCLSDPHFAITNRDCLSSSTFSNIHLKYDVHFYKHFHSNTVENFQPSCNWHAFHRNHSRKRRKTHNENLHIPPTIISMALCKTAVFPMSMHWKNHNLALSYQFSHLLLLKW